MVVVSSETASTDLKLLLKELVAWAQAQQEIMALYLYGSHATGNANALSDVADFESLIWRQYWDVRPHLERAWEHYVQQVMEQQSESERRQYQAALAKVRAVHRRVREAAVAYPGDIQE